MTTKEASLALAFAILGAGLLRAQAPTRSVAITANDLIRFSVAGFTAKPGEVVHVEFRNLGSLPKSVMGHNWILLKTGRDGASYSLAAASAKDENYEPKALASDVLASIGLLGPKEAGEVTFAAPMAPGEYVYLCSFPAHFQAGMRGVMTVK